MNAKKLHGILEYNNHLTNVLTVSSDKKLYNSISQTYSVNIVSASDYYPFGWAMPERTYSSSNYRFGFNGMEKNEEINSGSYTTEFRQYDSRVSRFTGVDPAANLYYSWSTYSFSMCSPILNSDPSGATVVIPSEGTEERKMYDEAMKVPEFAEQISILDKSKDIFRFSLLEGDNGYIEQDNYVNRPKEEGGDYTEFTIHFGKSDPNQLNGLGKSEFHPLFEEVFHTADYVENRSSSYLGRTKDGKLRLSHAKSDLQHEARAWNFAANYAPNPPRQIENEIDGTKVLIPNPLIQRIRALKSNPDKPDVQISKWLYEGFRVKLQFPEKGTEADYDFPPIYSK